jgi:hypothetical protein
MCDAAHPLTLRRYVVWKHQMLMVYTPLCESGGTFWHRIFKFIMVAVVISQATLIGVIATKQGVKMGPFLLPLPVISYLFYDHYASKYAGSVSSRVVAREVAVVVDRDCEHSPLPPPRLCVAL